MKFSDIPQFPRAHYNVHVGWDHLESHIEHLSGSRGFVMEPDYQRGHVWTREQQISYLEYSLMGGETGRAITVNCAEWTSGNDAPVELLDGLQRVTAALAFMHNKLPAFGHLFKEFDGRLRMVQAFFDWRVLELKTRADVLRQYLLMNAGGVVHSPEEIARVRKLLEKEVGK